jgi:predicted Zn-dependent peptidase
MALESSSVRAEQMARQLLGHDRLIAADELCDRVASVTPQHIKDYALTLASAKPAVTLVGSGKRALKQAKSAAAAVSATLAEA